MPRFRDSLLLATLAASGCAALDAVGFAPNTPDPEAVKSPEPLKSEPDRVEVRHILIAHEGSHLRGVTRTIDEASRLADKVNGLARSGKSFDELVKLYSDDRHGDGLIRVVNWGVPPMEGEGARQELPAAFAEAAFSLAPGQLAYVPYDKSRSPFGWHVIRREK